MDRMCSEFLPILTYSKKVHSRTLLTIQSLKESRKQSRKSRSFSRSLSNTEESRLAAIIQRLVDGKFNSQEEIVQQCRGIGRAQFYMVAEMRSSSRRCGNPLCAQIQISSKGIFCSSKCAYRLSGYARCIGDDEKEVMGQAKSKNFKLRKSKSSVTLPSYIQECNDNVHVEDIFPFANLHQELDSFVPQFCKYYKKKRLHQRKTSKDLIIAERSDKKYTSQIDFIHHLIEDNQHLIRAVRSDDSSTAFEIMSLVRRNSEKFCKERIKQEIEKIQASDKQQPQKQRNGFHSEQNLINAQRSDKQLLNSQVSDDFQKIERYLIHAQRSNDLIKEILNMKITQDQQNLERDLIHAQRSDDKQKSNLNFNDTSLQKFDRDLISAQRSDKQTLNSKVSDDFKKIEHDLVHAQRSSEPIAKVLNSQTSSDSLIFERDLIHAQRQNDTEKQITINCEESISEKFDRDLINAERSDLQNAHILNSGSNVNFDRDLVHAQRSDNEPTQILNSDESSLQKINDDLMNAKITAQTKSKFENENTHFQNSQNLQQQDHIHAIFFRCGNNKQCVCGQQMHTYLNFENTTELCYAYKDVLQNFVANSVSNSNFEQINNLFVGKNSSQVEHTNHTDQSCIKLQSQKSSSDDQSLQNQDNCNSKNSDLINAVRTYNLESQKKLDTSSQGQNTLEFDRDLINAERSDIQQVKQLKNSDDQISNSVEFESDLINAKRSDIEQVLRPFENCDNVQNSDFLEFDKDLISAERSDKLEINDGVDETISLNFGQDLINAQRSDNQEQHQVQIQISEQFEFHKDLITAERSDNICVQQIAENGKIQTSSIHLSNAQKIDNQQQNTVQNSDLFEFEQDLINTQRSDQACQKLDVENEKSLESLIPPNDLINANRSDNVNSNLTVNQQTCSDSGLDFQNDLIIAQRCNQKDTEQKQQSKNCDNAQNFDRDLINAQRSDDSQSQFCSVSKHIEHVPSDVANAQILNEKSSQIQIDSSNSVINTDLVDAERSDKTAQQSLLQTQISKNCESFDRDLINADRSDQQVQVEYIVQQNNLNSNFEKKDGMNLVNGNQSCLKLNGMNGSCGVNVLFDDDLTDTSSAYSDENDDEFVVGQQNTNITHVTLKNQNKNDDIEDQDEFLLNDLIFAERSDKQSQKNHNQNNNNSNDSLKSDENLKNLKQEGDLSKKEKSDFLSMMESAFEFTRDDSNSNIQMNKQLIQQAKQKEMLKLDLSSTTRDNIIFEENSSNIEKSNFSNIQFSKNVLNAQNTLDQGNDNDENMDMARCTSLPAHDYLKSPRNLQQGILKKSLSSNYSQLKRLRKVTFGMPQTFYLPPAAKEAPLRAAKRKTPINSKFLEDDNVKKFDQFLQKQQRKITCKVTTEEKNLQDELLKAFKRGCEESDDEEEICSTPQKKENSLFSELQNSLKIRDGGDDCLSSDDEDLDDFMSVEQRQKQSSDSDEDSDSDCEEWHLPLFQAKGGPQVEMSMYAKMQTFFGECMTQNSREWLSKGSETAKETACDCSQLAIRNAFQQMMSGRLDDVILDLQIKCNKDEIENTLTQLIKTMRFRKPLPGQGTPVWDFVLIGLLMALSLNQVAELQPLFQKNGLCKLLTEYVTENGDGMDIQQFMQLKDRFQLHASSSAN